MRLNNAKSKKCNALSYTIHRKFGLVWTDGQAVYLNPLLPTEEYASTSPSEVRSKPEAPITLGQFREVESVTWSDTTHPCSFLSVVLKQDSKPECSQLQVWQMVHTYPKVELSLLLSQEFAGEPARYGCTFWDVSVKKLCILMKQNAIIYYYEDEQLKFNCKCKVEPSLEHEEFRCACWSNDSKVLLLAFRMGVALYEADEQGVIIHPFITVNLPGAITVTAVAGEAFLCSCELMLENLVANAKGEPKSLDQLDSEHLSCQGDCPPSGAAKMFQVFLPKLPVPEESSCLAIVSEGGHILSKLNVNNVLVPNILTWLPFNNWCLVGSTNSKQLLLFSLTDNILNQINEIDLPSNFRPRGIAATGNSDDSIFIAVSDCSSYNHLYPITKAGLTNQHTEIFHVPFDILLHKNLLMIENGALASPSSSHLDLSPSVSLRHKTTSPTIRKSIKQSDSTSSCNLETTLQKVVNILLHKHSSRDRIVKSSQEDMKPDLVNIDIEKSLFTPQINNHLQSGAIIRPEIDELYHSIKNIDSITVNCEVGNKDAKLCQFTKDIMLLPGGRLKLQTLLDSFNIECVEIFTGTKFVVVTYGADGCLPVKFQNGEKVWIRAKPKLIC